MGVDYEGNYGFGVKIFKKEFDEDSEYYEEFENYLDDNLPEDTGYFEVGDGMYSGDENDIYIYIKDPLKDGYDLNPKVEYLLSVLKRLEINKDGDLGIIGGLHLY